MIEALIEMAVVVVMEVVGPVLVELLIELGFERLGVGLQSSKSRPPIVRAFGWGLLGLGMGGLTVLVVPSHMITDPELRWLSLITSPLLGGASMYGVRRWREKRESPATSLASFLGGAAFALGMSSVRFFFAG